MFETLKKYLIEERNIDESIITMDATLVDDLGINSIDQAAKSSVPPHRSAALPFRFRKRR